MATQDVMLAKAKRALKKLPMPDLVQEDDPKDTDEESIVKIEHSPITIPNFKYKVEFRCGDVQYIDNHALAMAYAGKCRRDPKGRIRSVTQV